MAPTPRPPLPVAKSRAAVDHWSANNGSVIYTQSNIVKKGMLPPTQARLNMSSSNNQRPENRKTSDTTTGTRNGSTFGGKISSISSMFVDSRNGTSTQSAKSNSATTNMIPGDSSKQPSHDDIPRAGDSFKYRNPEEDSFNSNRITSTLTNNREPLDDMETDLTSHLSSSRWSNGTCTTSDLLF